MAIDGDQFVALPEPPPPRPAARREAIEAALRKFEGVEEPKGQERQPRPGKVKLHRGQFGALVTTALIAVVSVPAAFIALRNQPPAEVALTNGPPVTQYDRPGDVVTPAPAQPMVPEPPPTAAPTPSSRSRAVSLVPNERTKGLSLVEPRHEESDEAPAAPAVAAPPPPPPPPAPARTGQTADEAQNVVVTGSRIAAPGMSKQSDTVAMAERSAEPGPIDSDDYGEFLSGLQASVRENDQRAIAGLIAFPLRVTRDGQTRVYRSSNAVLRDFDEIFTPRVRAAILSLREGSLQSQGKLAGNGAIRFGPSCQDSVCPIRIREVSP